MFYIYAHTRNDTNQIFYIGKGKGNRAYSKNKRNPHWHNIVNKVGYSVEILARFNSEQDAFQQEINCIKWLDNLCNLTKGGEGCSGMTLSDEAKHKIRAANLGKKLSDEHKIKLLAANLGRKFSEEHKAKIGAASRGNTYCAGRILSDETKAKIGAAILGKKHTSETRAKLSEIQSGENNPSFKGKILATNILTGEQQIFIGKEICAAGFNQGHVSECVNGKAKTHKGHTFERLPIC